MERVTPFAVGEYYHIYTRGVEKRSIFLNDDDHTRFQRLLYGCNSSRSIRYRDMQKHSLSEIDRKELLVDIGAYVLMPNHVHLLVHEKSKGGITHFMGKLLTAYSMYFNKKYDRSGHLFQGRFQSQHADSDEYLKYLFSYIHLNPVDLIEPSWKENGIKDIEKTRQFLKTYHTSSYPDYLNGMNREESVILSPGQFPEYFSEARGMQDEVTEWLNSSKPL